MIVTEEEAKTKRCQEGFAAATGISVDGVPVMQPASAGPAHPHGAAGYYAVSHGGAPMNCLGSACMAWRWHEGAIPEQYETIATHDGALPTHGEKWEKVKRDRPFYAPEGHLVDWEWRRVIKEAMPRTGYCGKAGKP